MLLCLSLLGVANEANSESGNGTDADESQSGNAEQVGVVIDDATLDDESDEQV